MVQQIQVTTPEVEVSFAVGKVLIVDEDVEDLNYHAKLFEAKGFTVSKCELYERAIRSIEKENFDLVVSDQGPSALEGQLVLRYLKRCQPSTPCVVIGRNASARKYLRMMELGAADCLDKPLTSLDVTRILRDYVRIGSAK